MAGKYLTAVCAGRDFAALLSGREDFYVHSVFPRAINLWDGQRFLTLLPLGRGGGAVYATLAVEKEVSFSSWGLAPGQKVELLPGDCLRVGPEVIVDFSSSVPWQSPLERIKRLPSLNPHNLRAFKLALLGRRTASPFKGFLQGEGSKAETLLEQLEFSVVAPERAELEQALAGILGWGPGLTPSGDDLILGLSMARGVIRKALGLGPGLWEISVRRILNSTHPLSAFFIEEALKGRGHEFVETALASLLGMGKVKPETAAERLFDLGATSGFDMALGLYLALEWQRRYSWCLKG
ncbi:MAG: DUF2877 domain-containing protein [Moorellaceae bacterium]